MELPAALDVSRTARVASGSADRNLFDDLDPESFERHDAARVIGQQADRVEAKVGENLGADAHFMLRWGLREIAVVTDELAIFDTQAEGGLMQVDEHALTLLDDALQGIVNHRPAIAPCRTQQVAVRAMGVHANEHVLLAGDIAANQREVR